MPADNSLKESLEYFREQERKLLGELESVRFTIRRIEQELGIQSEQAESLQVPIGAPPGETETRPFLARKRPDIRPDEFFGMSQTEAAKAYLRKVGHAVSLDELLEALKTGGCKVGGANPKRVLYIGLVRDTRNFVPVQSGVIGLREFYPSLKSGAEKRVRAQTSRPRRATRPRRQGRTAEEGNKEESASTE